MTSGALWAHSDPMSPRELSARVGGYSEIARALGLRHHSTVLRWRRIPDHHVVALEQLFAIPRSELRPDLYEAARSASGPVQAVA